MTHLTKGDIYAIGSTNDPAWNGTDTDATAVALLKAISAVAGAGGGGTGANPSATIGLAAVNGAATTFLRSDGAPALSQAISPTWTGSHTWTQQLLAPGAGYSFSGDTDTGMYSPGADILGFKVGGVTRWSFDGTGILLADGTIRTTGNLEVGNVAFGNGNPNIFFYEFGVATDVSAWRINIDAGVFSLQSRTDGNGAGVTFFSATRGTGTAITEVAIPAGQLKITEIGKGLSIAEGSNAKMGTAVLSGGSVTVSTTAVTANSRIFSYVNGGTITNLGTQYEDKATRVAGTSFTIKSLNVLDASTIAWMIVEPS